MVQFFASQCSPQDLRPLEGKPFHWRGLNLVKWVTVHGFKSCLHRLSI